MADFKLLSREFYLRDGIAVAKGLLGKLLVCRGQDGLAAGRIVETEAYMGAVDPASHARTGKPTPRTEIMYGPGGYAYVYFIYGMYFCFNVVANVKGTPHAVLVRALEPVEGLELMSLRRGTGKRQNLCSGPGKLCGALGIVREHNGADLCGNKLFIAEGEALRPDSVSACPRIGVDYAGEAAAYPWRFLEKGSPYVSKPPLKE